MEKRPVGCYTNSNYFFAAKWQKIAAQRQDGAIKVDYVYGAMWLIIALLLIFKMSKENKIFYFLGGFFALMGVWWILNAMLPAAKLFAGVPGMLFKVAAGVALVVIGIFYYKNYYRNRKK